MKLNTSEIQFTHTQTHTHTHTRDTSTEILARLPVVKKRKLESHFDTEFNLVNRPGVQSDVKTHSIEGG
jgi:hypothetical protein